MAIKLFLGVPGAGKTLAMQDLVHEMVMKQKWPCYIIDNAFEWLTETLSGETNIRWRGKPPRIIRMPPPNAVDEVESALDDGHENPAALVFEKFDGWTPFEVATLMTVRGNAIYCDDEIDLFATYKNWEENPLRGFIHRGRHLPNAENVPTEVHVFGAARRPQNLHTDLTSMADEVLCFRLQGKNTLKRVIDEGYVTPESIDDVRAMPNLEYYKWNSGGSITKGKLKPL